MTETCTNQEVLLIEEILHRIAADISMITDRELVVGPSASERAQARPAGKGQVHISFRFGVERENVIKHGCLLLPLAEAISLAGYLMMLSDAEVAKKRKLAAPDEPLKEALLEVGNFISGATDAALREVLADGSKVRPEGCQGVRADVRPALIYEEGTTLLVGRVQGTLTGYPEFDMTLMLEELPSLQVEAPLKA